MATVVAPLTAGNNANQNGAQPLTGPSVLSPITISPVIGAPTPNAVFADTPSVAAIG